MRKVRQRFTYSELSEIQYSEDEDENLNLVNVEENVENVRYLPDLTDTGNFHKFYPFNRYYTPYIT